MLRRSWLWMFALGLCLASGPLGEVRAQQRTEEETAVAIFAGGCFWCMESAFDPVEGVLETISGYTGGKTANPTYDAVKLGRTGHYEALKVVYDPRRVDYETLLYVFWRNIDPFNPRGQFCDRGSQYRAAIFVADAAQREAAQASKDAISERTKLKIVTQILPLDTFYPAEEYHQNYYLKHPLKYRYYRSSCGRDRRLVEIWGAEAGGKKH
jgi:peptide-methionine (S)-S-oxide reductase